MTSPPRQTDGRLRLPVVILRIAAVWALTAVGVVAAEGIPNWVSETPQEAGRTFFIGTQSDEPTREAGVEGAFRDAAAQAAKFIRARWTYRTLEQDNGLEGRLFEELRGSARGTLHRFEIKKRHCNETRTRRRGRGERRFDCWVLVALPEGEIREERSRLDQAGKRRDRALSSLCKRLGEKVHKRSSISIGTFKRQDDGYRYPLSGILETHFRTCFQDNGLVVKPSKARFIAEGEFWIAPDGTNVTARLIRVSNGQAVSSQRVRFPTESLDEDWIKGPLEGFFSMPDKAKPYAPGSPPGFIQVLSRPEGALVYVNGRRRGPTPLIIPGLKPGVYSVALELKDYIPFSKEVSVDGGERETVSTSLERKSGTLLVRSSPSKATVFIDGEAKGLTAKRIGNLPTGRYRVSLELERHKPHSETVEIQYKRVTRIEPKLEEKDGSLFLFGTPGAIIFLDGTLRGEISSKGKLRLGPVSSGAHRVRAMKAGFEPDSWKVNIRPEETKTFDSELVKSGEAVAKIKGPGFFKRYATRRTERRERRKLSKEARTLTFKIPSLRRPRSMTYASIGSATLGSGYSNLRLFEGVYYPLNSRIGFGTSIVSLYSTGAEVPRSRLRKSFSGTQTLNSSHALSLSSIFPMQLYLVPIAHEYEAYGRSFVASVQFFVQASFWAKAQLEGTEIGEDGNEGPTGSVLDYGVLVHAGPGLGLRVGVVKTEVNAFGSGTDSYGKSSTKKFYIAADISFGAFFSGGSSTRR